MASYHFKIKSGKKGTAATHASYIAREGKHGSGQKEHDLVCKGHGNLPPWAKGNPSTFWRMADDTERVNGAAYREFVVALPVELTDEQNRKLVADFIKQEVGPKAYQFAIHKPKAALGDVDQPHGHIMFSDRMPDDIDRRPDQYFRRYRSHRPDAGGCRKDSGGRFRGELKNELISRRENWANLQNEHLERHGHVARVDHRSYKDQGLDCPVEAHLGPAYIRHMSEDEKTAVRNERQAKAKGSD